jgi:hypothetical protein
MIAQRAVWNRPVRLSRGEGCHPIPKNPYISKAAVCLPCAAVVHQQRQAMTHAARRASASSFAEQIRKRKVDPAERVA